MPAVTPFLWFDDDAESAIRFYTELVPGSRIVSLQRYADGMPRPGGKVMHARFELGGAEYFAMDAGPQYRFTEAISLYLPCRDQAEFDPYWDALTADGGEEQPCGWLKDRWGLSWQVVPDRLVELIRDPDPGRSHRAVQAMLAMRRIDISALETAADG